MKPSRLLPLAGSLLFPGASVRAAGPEASLFAFTEDAAGGLRLAGPGVAPEIWVSPNELPGVIRVANDLAADFGRVLGTNATVVSTDFAGAAKKTSSRPVIVLGTVGKSSLVDGLVSAKKVDAGAVAGKWETFSFTTVSAPWDGVAAAFVLAGSDLRGSVFAAYSVSEIIGVSPWYYWADAPPKKRTHIFVRSAGAASTVVGPPSVKFRGIFLNDEDPGLSMTSWGSPSATSKRRDEDECLTPGFLTSRLTSRSPVQGNS